MPRHFPAIFLFASMHAASAAPAAPTAAPPGAGYQLLFEDTFAGPTPDTAKWRYRLGARTGLNIDGLNTQASVSQREGNLIIKSDIEMIDGKEQNTGGGLISNSRFGFGYYEVRAKPYLGASGLHSAFWQLGAPDGAYPNTIFEIDSFEIDAPHRHTTHNLYVRPNGLARKEAPWPYRSNMPIDIDSDGWTVSAYEYGPDGITFYDNGKVVARATYPQDFPDLVAQQNVWLTALNGVGKVDKQKQPGHTYFDYFRYYAKDYPGQNILPNGTFEYNRTQIPLQTPMAWEEQGDVAASTVRAAGDAHSGEHVLRHGGDGRFRVATHQTLQHIRDGRYALAAWVRTSTGIGKASISAHSGAMTARLAIAPGATWRKVELPSVTVKNNTVQISLDSSGEAGQWIEFDDVTFMKPAPAPLAAVSRRYDPLRDPVWRIFESEPMRFTGDDTFFFFDRNVGLGDAFSVTVTLDPAGMQNALPVMRRPRTGTDGWAVGIEQDGAAYCAAGSTADHVRVRAASAYRDTAAVTLGCVYERGMVRLYVDGVERAAEQVAGHGASEATAAGRLGATAALFDAMGDVTASVGSADRKGDTMRNFVGSVSKVGVFNRALSAAEMKAIVIR